MATVDFSNAQISWVNSNTNLGDIGILATLIDTSNNCVFSASSTSNVSIVSGLVKTRYNIDKEHGYVIYTGTFTDSGTTMVWHNATIATANYAYFQITNISFNSGDVFSFKVDVDFTFNN